ncbi:hypothetical protein ONZ45_g9148 [Pleurotus djamor]|nr:hypothetical protein ONZ45_g9148 [Pleurotus djamor]
MGFISDAHAKALGQEAEASIWNNDNSTSSAQPQQDSGEQRFGILPHPAKTNDPNDLNKPSGNSFGGNAGIAAHHARDPHIPDQQTLNTLGSALSREELHKKQEELNK